jgi:hypothetical protein
MLEVNIGLPLPATQASNNDLILGQRLYALHGTRSHGTSVDRGFAAPARRANGLLTLQRQVIGILGYQHMGQEGKVAHGDGVFRGCCLCLYQR